MDCLQTVSELYIYFKCPISRKQTIPNIISLRQSILCGYDSVTFFVGGGGCLVCLIVLVVKLLTGFEAFGPPVKDFALGVSVVILNGASVVQILKGVGASTVQLAVYKRCFKTLPNIYFLCSWSSGFSVQHMLGRQFKVSKGAKIRNRYNQVPHLTQDTKGKVTKSRLDTTNEH